jgi:cyclic pyranopterin monophosphate synthase
MGGKGVMEITHFNASGKVHIVDITSKDDTVRQAVAEGRLTMRQETLSLIRQGQLGKGDVLGVAQLAGIMGAKRTAELIPLCHPLLLTGIDIELVINDAALDGAVKPSVDIRAVVQTTGKTGVEMEALMAVTVAALTIYDMCKAVDKGMMVEHVRLSRKSGGKSGEYVCEQLLDAEGNT